MAYLKAGPILTRIREVLEDSAGTLRTIPSARFLGDDPEGLSLDAERARLASKPRFLASIPAVRPSPASPPVIGDLAIYEFDVEVRVSRLVSPIEQLDDDTADTLRALAFADADVVAQALGYPNNLTQTAAGTATDIVSGLLRFVSSNEIVIGQIDDGAQTLTTRHLLRGLAISRPAI